MGHEVTVARAALEAARELAALTAAPHRPLMDALVEIELLTAEAVLARGAGLLRASATPPLTGMLRVLLGARRKARKAR